LTGLYTIVTADVADIASARVAELQLLTTPLPGGTCSGSQWIVEIIAIVFNLFSSALQYVQ
jgi:hypothetical protein